VSQSSPVENSNDRIASVYLAFAEREAHGRSALYEELARRVARDAVVLSFLATLPRPKQQPNLLFSAMKYLCGVPTDWDHFARLLRDHKKEVAALMMARSTQTNEPARCATLLPLLARIPGPLALLEIGAAAGLCLLPDKYAYDYEGRRVLPSSLVSANPPVFCCRANRAPLPVRGLDVIWRAGLDLRPIDIGDHEEVGWLEALVWPDEGDRLELLRAALEIARRDPPKIFEGDLRTELPALIRQAPQDVTLVVFHTAVLGYLPSAADRSAFAQAVKNLGVVWVSNEPPALLPQLTLGIERPWPLGQFLLSMNGKPIAWTDPHGTSVDWIADS